jgi:ABC-2 type transport system ATP-binding protein
MGYEIESDQQRDVRRDVARVIVDKGWGLLELRPNRLSLEEIFLQLTTDEKTGIATGNSHAAEEVPHA